MKVTIVMKNPHDPKKATRLTRYCETMDEAVETIYSFMRVASFKMLPKKGDASNRKCYPN